MLTKTCTKCGNELAATVENFAKQKGGKYGLHSRCNACEHARWATYRLNNPDKVKQTQRAYYLRNPEHFKLKRKKWATMHPDYSATIYQRDPIKGRNRTALWRKNNPEKYKLTYTKAFKKVLATTKGRLNINFSNHIRYSLKGNKNGLHWESIVGYTTEQLRQHLESKFLPGMTWENYGRHGWHIDHIIPIDFFEFSKPEDQEFQYCWSLYNLQPLWEIDNIRKSNKIEIGGAPCSSQIQLRT